MTIRGTDQQEAYAFPDQLVEEILARWHAMPHSESAPVLPPTHRLKRLLEVAYVASLEINEGRAITFTLCCTPEGELVTRGADEGQVETWLFSSGRDYDVAELSRLATALDLNSAAMWVEFPEDPDAPMRVRGLLNLGFSWAIARQGFAARHEALPHALTLRIDGPGSITVYQNQAALLALASGRLQGSQSLPDSLFGVHGLIDEGLGYFTERLAQQNITIEPPSVELLRLAYLNVLVSTINGIKRLGHGGALVLAAEASPILKPRRNLVKPKYRLDGAPFFLSEHFLSAAASRFLRASLAKQLDPETIAEMPTTEYATRLQQLHLLDLEARTSSQRILESSNFVANLSGTDGATVMRTNLAVVGFGAEIAAEAIETPPVYEVWEGSKVRRRLDLEQFGMRHRSAMRLCAAAPDVAVFVISQDGGVSLIFNRDGKVCIRRNITTLNANM
ncbi:MAG TPA: hypothetical protein V6D47_22045 [Oscillatoriaceae cyanobacterium]